MYFFWVHFFLSVKIIYFSKVKNDSPKPSKTHQELQILYNIHTHKTLHFSHNKKEGEYTIINEIALKYD